MPYKPYSDSYLMSLTKSQIIELLRTAEHNYFTTENALANSVKAGQEFAERLNKAKELLKDAVECISKNVTCISCDFGSPTCEHCIRNPESCDYDDCFKWKHYNEAIALVEHEI